MKATLLAMATLLLALPAAANAESSSLQSLKHAKALCKFFDTSGFSSKPCSVEVGRNINVWLDMDSSEARNLCPQVAKMARDAKYNFSDGWRLNIYSPYSGGSTIAFCNL